MAKQLFLNNNNMKYIYIKVWLILLAFSTSTYAQFKGVCINDDCNYDVGSQTIELDYAPLATDAEWFTGVLRTVALNVTNDNAEMNISKTYNRKIKVHVYYPEKESGDFTLDQTKLPVIVYGYGGGFLKRWSTNRLKQGQDDIIPSWLAKKGYIVVCPEYRIGIDLYNEQLSERAIWRAVQDVRVVNRYAREISTSNFNADQEAPLTFMGWSSGAFIGLHNLYMEDSGVNRPASTKDLEVFYNKQPHWYKIPDYVTESVYDLGTLDEPRMGTGNGAEAFERGLPQYEGSPIQDITVAISGAMGKRNWIETSTNPIPKALFMMHHANDGVVPSRNGHAYEGFSLFANDDYDYPSVSGTHVINELFNEPNSDVRPQYYEHIFIDPNCGLEEELGVDELPCITGDAGGSKGPLGKEVWYHDPMEGSANLEVMEAIISFIGSSITQISNEVTLPEETEVEGNTYLIIGQSNSAGRGILPTDLVPYDGVSVLDDSGVFIPATPNLNEYSTIRKDVLQGYNLGYTFGGSMAHISGEDVKLIVNSRGGTSLSKWQKDAAEGYFKAAVDRVNLALEDPNNKLAGIIWHQGESNSSGSISNYVNNLKTLIEDFRAEFNDPSLPFIAGQLNDKPENESFNTGILTLPDEVLYTEVVTSEDLVAPDETHFNTDGLRILGDRYALKMLAVKNIEATLENLPIHNFQSLPENFQPDTTKVYHIKSLQGNLLAANAETRTTSSVSGSTVGPSVEWKFVNHDDSANFHIDLNSGGTYSRLYPNDTAVAGLTRDIYNGSNTYFTLAEKVAESKTYHITAIDESNADHKRLFLNPNSGVAGMTDVGKIGSWSTFEFIEVDPVAIFEPDVTKTYHIKSSQGNLLAADAEARTTSSVSTSTVGPSVEWKFVEKSPGLYHIDLNSGGTYSRLYPNNTAIAGLTQDSFSGANTYFSIAEKTPGSGTYHITAIDEENTDFQRLFLNPNSGVAGMSDVGQIGSWSTFEIIEVDPVAIFEPDVTKTYQIRSLEGKLLAADAGVRETSAVSTSTHGSSVEWKFVEKSPGLYHIDLASGGTYSRLYPNDTAIAGLTQDSFSGANTYFSITERTPGSGAYHITAIDEENTDFQRLFLNPNSGVAGMTDIESIGTWATFEIIEVFKPVANQSYYLQTIGSDPRRLGALENEGTSKRTPSTYSITATGGDVEWKLNNSITNESSYLIALAGTTTLENLGFISDEISGVQPDMTNHTITMSVRILETASGSGMYHITYNNLTSEDSRLRLNSQNNSVGFVATDKTGDLSTFEIIPVPASSAKSIIANEESLTTDFTISPNPVTDIITIKGLRDGDLIEIYDLSGRKITETSQEEINLSYLESGLYFVKITGRLKMVKMIKQ